MTAFGDRAFRREGRLHEATSVGPNPPNLMSPQEEKAHPQDVSPRETCERTADYTPGRGLRGNQPYRHLDLGLQLLELRENKFLMLKSPSLWYSVTAALADVCTYLR